VQGWIKLHRKIRLNPIFNDMELLRLWLICLTEAAHKPYEQLVGRQTVQLKPGQFVTGRFDLSEMYNSGLKRDQQKSPKTIWRWLEALEKGGFLTIKTTNKYSVITVNNWDFYQGFDQHFDQQVTNKRPTNDQQVTTNKNVKNDKNEKKNTSSSKKSPTYSEDSPYLQMAKYFYNRVSEVARAEGLQHLIIKADMQKWADEFRKLVEIDKVEDKHLIRDVMDWVTTHHFWKTNVLSARKLREKFGELALKMKTEQKQKSKHQTPKTSDPRDKEIAFQRWVMEGNDPNEFDWSGGRD
jgi:hypothetical protein